MNQDDSKMNCEACGYLLDRRGRCRSCMNVAPENLEAARFETVYWSVCPDHGAYEANHSRRARISWYEPDPRDKRRKICRVYWTWRCPACSDFSKSDRAMPFKELILRRPEISRAEIMERIRAFHGGRRPTQDRPGTDKKGFLGHNAPLSGIQSSNEKMQIAAKSRQNSRL